jgi:hypothetical protein
MHETKAMAICALCRVNEDGSKKPHYDNYYTTDAIYFLVESSIFL